MESQIAIETRRSILKIQFDEEYGSGEAQHAQKDSLELQNQNGMLQLYQNVNAIIKVDHF